MRTSEYALGRLKEYEGLRLKAYKCPAGVWTIGYGHTKDVRGGIVIDKETADKLLEEDVMYFEKYLAGEPYAEELTQGQWDALISFLFNLGIGNYIRSTLRKRIIEDVNHNDIPNQFRRWNKADGKVLPGLVRRREWEAQMYEWE
jgi:lysozyme